MKRSGFGWFIRRFHGKDLSRQTGRVAMCGFLGERVAGGGWKMMNGDQPAPGATEQNVQAMADGRQINWLGAQISARRDLELDPEETTFTVEFEQSQFRNPKHFHNQEQHWKVVMGMLLGSMQFITGIEHAAAANVALEQLVEAHSTIKHPKTWSWQLEGINLIDADPIIEDALKWEIPELSDTSGFVLGSDLTKAT